MGGDEPAHTLIAAALAMGKAVVTANKHVIAHHGPELEAIARRTGAALRFEAAVGGGIPVLGPLASDLAANRVDRVRGIVNGTTNYILTAMADRTAPLDYADGARRGAAARLRRGRPVAATSRALDAVNKLVILARLAFGRWLDPADDRDARPTAAAARPARASPASRSPTSARRAAARPDHPAARHGVASTPTAAIAAVGPADGAAARLAARPDGRRPQPDRGRRRTASAGSGSTARAPAAPRRQRPSSATSWRSPAARARPGPGWRPRRLADEPPRPPVRRGLRGRGGVRYADR